METEGPVSTLWGSSRGPCSQAKGMETPHAEWQAGLLREGTSVAFRYHAPDVPESELLPDTSKDFTRAVWSHATVGDYKDLVDSLGGSDQRHQEVGGCRSRK